MNTTELTRDNLKNQLVAIDRRLTSMIEEICKIVIGHIDIDITDHLEKASNKYLSFAEHLEWLKRVLISKRSKLLKGDLSKLRNFTKKTEDWLIDVDCQLRDFSQTHDLLERVAYEFDEFDTFELDTSHQRKRQLRGLLRRISSDLV